MTPSNDNGMTGPIHPEPGAVARAVAGQHVFGACPLCGRSDGHVNAGRAHWGICAKHRLIWSIGAHLFSGADDETEAEQREVWERRGIERYRMVEPLYVDPLNPSDVRPGSFVPDLV